MLAKESTVQEEDRFHISSETMNYDDRTKVLNHSDSFAIFDRSGDIHPHSKKAHGIFHKGTRFINRLELRVNKKKPLLLSSAIKEDNDILSVDLTNPDLGNCNIPENSIHISRSQFLRNGVYYEEIDVANYGEAECSLVISLTFGADFRDLFEIRGMTRTLHPHRPHTRTEGNRIFFDYEGLDHIKRQSEIILRGDHEMSVDNNKVEFALKLAPHQPEKLDYLIIFHTEEVFFSKENVDNPVLDFEKAKKQLLQELQGIHQLFADIDTSNEQFTHWIKRSKTDLVSLITDTSDGLYPYAGVPWYNTAFGRDGIITAMEVLWIAPEIARNALLFLAKRQATGYDPSADAEPGKILHETRSGEMANTGEVPFKQYYGTIDATPLFVMLAGMYFERTADLQTIQTIWPHITAALQWIDQSGDLDGDGFVEYKQKAENGLSNQGWKDSYDSIMYKDGGLCEPPIALCEVQGYVYAAKYFAALMASALGEKQTCHQLQEQALRLKERFNKIFWDESSGCFALALDGQKNPCRVVSSNAGHGLFTGIVDEKHAERLARTLTGQHMFGGWGVRTLSAQEKRYNPMSYHNGSVWPHDNALIAMGLSKYGFHKEAMDIMSALFSAALYIELQRLPELYCGFDRRPNEGPTSYPVACSPQAWSVGSVFLLLQSCLHISINALERTISFKSPQLPDYLDTISIKNLSVGEACCSIDLYRHNDQVVCKISGMPKKWKIVHQE